MIYNYIFCFSDRKTFSSANGQLVKDDRLEQVQGTTY